MRQVRLTGPGAGSDKYDILTALAVTALRKGGHLQVTVLRLMSLITARYNWTQDEFAVGYREMAQMWSVDERTAKREVKRFLDLGLVTQVRKGAKGRVSIYRLDLVRITELTQDAWACVGRDFETRMNDRCAEAEAEDKKVVQVDFATGQKIRAEASPQLPNTPWGRTLARLSAVDASRCAAWFAQLQIIDDRDGNLVLLAPSRFSAGYIKTHLQGILEEAVRQEYGSHFRCVVTG